MKTTWRIGDVTVKKLTEIEFRFSSGSPGTIVPDAHPEEIKQIGWLSPNFADKSGQLKGSVHALLLSSRSMRMIVDPCIGNGKKRSLSTFNMLETPFLERLERLGWGRNQVTHVICTHMHVDHVGWNTVFEDDKWVPTFPKARYYFGRQDFQHYFKDAHVDRREMLADSVIPIMDAGLATLVEMDARITPEVRLIPTPGHSPGHASILIESAGKRAVISGDVVHHPCQLAHPNWSSDLDYDKNAARSTRMAFLEEFADKEILFIGTHFAGPTAGKLVRDGAGYRLTKGV
jgi:glyoxylase-like metal-dependent hydrolase (beta-lactamase superfamily II)